MLVLEPCSNYLPVCSDHQWLSSTLTGSTAPLARGPRLRLFSALTWMQEQSTNMTTIWRSRFFPGTIVIGRYVSSYSSGFPPEPQIHNSCYTVPAPPCSSLCTAVSTRRHGGLPDAHSASVQPQTSLVFCMDRSNVHLRINALSDPWITGKAS